jgi:hypothetical protein
LIRPLALKTSNKRGQSGSYRIVLVFLSLEFLMLVTLSGRIGRAVSTTDNLLPDGSGHTLVAEVPLGITVAESVTDWYLLKFTEAALVKAAQFIVENAQVSAVGDMVFEDFLDSDQIRRSKPVVTVSDFQLERFVKADSL